MNEAEWWSSTDPQRMIDALRDHCDMRKWHLFAVETCRHAVAAFEFPHFEDALAIGTRAAENYRGIPYDEYYSAWYTVDQASVVEGNETLNCVAEAVSVAISPHLLTFGDGQKVVDAVTRAHRARVPGSIGREHFCYQADLLRELFGNPFTKPYFKPAWRTGTVTAMANTIYTTPAFEHLPILADALEEAGCNITDLLDHCRSSVRHTRGCWAVDLVLGID